MRSGWSSCGGSVGPTTFPADCPQTFPRRRFVEPWCPPCKKSVCCYGHHRSSCRGLPLKRKKAALSRGLLELFGHRRCPAFTVSAPLASQLPPALVPPASRPPP